MATQMSARTPDRLSDRLIAIRDRWHCRNHPFYADLAAGRLELRHLGTFLVQHYLVVRQIFRTIGIAYAKAPDDIARNIIENLAEEAGLLGIDGHAAHNHTDLILAFTRHVGIADDDVRGGELLPTWLARAALMRWVTEAEPAAIRFAVQASTESQLVGENGGVVVPALVEHYGFRTDDPTIGFFTEHAFADVKHGDEMYALVDRHVVSPDDQRRAEMWTTRMCRLRWASFNELYRETVEGVRLEDTLPG
ncbi:MAG: TenA family transcriptional regulator [Rhodospirillales bacterium]